jgi:hypothetical protein
MWHLCSMEGRRAAWKVQRAQCIAVFEVRAYKVGEVLIRWRLQCRSKHGNCNLESLVYLLKSSVVLCDADK